MKKMTDADKAKLKKLAAGKGALANGKLSMDQKLELQGLKRMERQSRSYSPAPMSAAAKAKAAAAGASSKKASSARKVEKLKSTGLKKTNFDKTARGAKAGSSVVSKVVKRAKTVGREARDVVTAAGTVGNAAYNTYFKGDNALNVTTTSKKNLSGAAKNFAKQVKEVKTAATKGTKGTTSAKSGGRARGEAMYSKSKGKVFERELKQGKQR